MYKKCLCSLFSLMFIDYSFAEAATAATANASGSTAGKLAEATTGLSDSDKTVADDTASGLNPDWRLNLKFAHERKNQSMFGPKNCSAVAINPIIAIGDVHFESDFYYGHQNTFTGYLGSKRRLSRFVDDDKLRDFHNDYVGSIKGPAGRALGNARESHFYRLYSRATYENKEHNFRVIVGDTVPRNFIGFQTPISGAGISVFRQSGNSSEINSGLPFVITRLSKVECKLGDDILAVRVFAPGVYTLEDLPEEAKIPGVKLKISDQLNRSDVLTVNYFSGYGMLEKGKDDFDVSVLFAHKWDVLDPHKMRYNDKAHFSANHRYGVTDNVTSAIGVQYYDGQTLLDYNIIVATKVGIISPNIAYSDRSNESTKGTRAVGAGLFYMTPENSLGLTMEVFGGVKSSGFVDMGVGNEKDAQYMKLMRACCAADASMDVLRKYRSEGSDDSSRQLICRIYTKKPIIFGITPTFIFSGDWSSSRRYREYTLSLTKKFFDKATVTISAGLTYDDPYKGVNRESPDRHLTIACTIPVGDVSFGGDFYHHDDDRFRNHAKVEYKPSQIPGLEITTEHYSMPQYRNPGMTVKYEGKYFDVKAEEKAVFGTRNPHSDEQKFFFGTSISPLGATAYKKNSYLVLRSLREKK